MAWLKKGGWAHFSAFLTQTGWDGSGDTPQEGPISLLGSLNPMLISSRNTCTDAPRESFTSSLCFLQPHPGDTEN